LIALWIIVLITVTGSGAEDLLVILRTRYATFGVDAVGSLRTLSRNTDGLNYLATGQPSPLLSVRVAGKLHPPDNAAWDAGGKCLCLRFKEAQVEAGVRVEIKPTHVVLELMDIKPMNRVELILWGPYATTIGDRIGEVVGVVRDDETALGIQALNPKTLGGYPTRENDLEADYTADDPGPYANLPAELMKDQLFRGDTARRTEFGSVLQAYCRNRDRDRWIANWGHERYHAPAFKDGGPIGSKIALFACPAGQALETIGAIEVAEDLPHPTIDGVWVKTASNANCSYLIVDFSEQTIDRAIEMTTRAGLNYLYHSSPFETWGHFRLKSALFPNGWDGFRTCVDQARKAGVRIGFHTLSNFITPNDAYVTPKPDPRLARVGTSVLRSNIDATQTEIPIKAPDFFLKKTDMNTVVIGDELIRYGTVSPESPWRLLECERGAWGTQASAHAEREVVAKLMDHGYRVFLTDADLAQEVARNIARFCNHTGTLQISLDGLEGNWSTGLGQYGRTLFTKAWFDALLPSLRGQINDASNPGHFNWHIYSRMNWGEPWYAGFRESQTLYRFKNQLHFERNLMPRMLGWFALRPDTSIEDAEWLLARAAGFDAGFALAASLASTAQLAADPASTGAAKRFGATPAILAAIKQWETARRTQAFSPEVKSRLRDNSREFHLASAGPNQWDLYESHLLKAIHDASQSVKTALYYTNSNAEQPLHWIVRSTSKKAIKDLTLEINDKLAVALKDHDLLPGGSLKYMGGAEAVVYDATWKESGRVPVDSASIRVRPGIQQVKIACAQTADSSLKIELRTLGPAVRIGK